MIIRCPSCAKRISNKNKVCPHCDFDLGGAGEGLSWEEAQRRRARERNSLLQLHSYTALVLTVIGSIWSWVDSDQFSQRPDFWPLAVLSAGALWYLGVRLIMIYRKLRG